MKFTKLIILCIATLLSFQIDGQRKSKKSISPVVNAVDEGIYDAITYRSIGPFRGGRSCAVAGVPGKPNLFYFGATGGGVWKTNDGGRSWNNISDGFFGGSIGSIAVAASDPNVIYVGGGEKTVRGNVSFGYGVWKSEDAGKTWTQKGLKKSRHISRIRIHPSNPDIVFAAVMGNLYAPNIERGIFKSIDGGDTWKKVLYVNDEVGMVDLILDPGNARHMYASSWKIKRTPYSLSSGGEGSAIFKSTDNGETWEDISGNKGLPEGIWGISGVAVSPLNSDRVWAIIENENGGVFRSDDAGKTWRKLNSERSLRQRAWYYTRIYADTEDEDVVYVMNVNYHKSKDGGVTFESKRAPHGDHHDLWISPEDANRMIIGDDGGAQVSYDAGDTWSTYHNQPTAQFYRVTTDNSFPFKIYAAQQDNSTVRIDHRTSGSSIGDDDWEPTAGCECGHIAIDPLNNDLVYGGCYGGLIERLDHANDQTQSINVWPDNPMGHGVIDMKYRFQWNFPLFFSKHDNKTLYTASNHLHASIDQGQSWKTISPDLTRNDTTKQGSSGGPITKDNTSVEYYCTIFAADESPLKKGLLWVGSDDGLVHLGTDGGANWVDVTPAALPEWTMINSIEPDPFNEGGCYIVGTRYKLGDFEPYLFKTEDYGKTWTRIDRGIDREHFTRTLRADPDQKGLLYAGTESGMYVSFNDGQSWQAFQLNLPIVPITDLAIKEQSLVVATQGRSLWIIDDLTPLHQLNSFQSSEALSFFEPKDSYRMQGGQNPNPRGQGMNHPGGVMMYYYLKDEIEESDSLSIKIYDSTNKLINTYSNYTDEKAYKIDPKGGSNFFNWNMSYPPAEKFDGMILWWGSLNGPKALPGTYSASIDLNGMTKSHDFIIRKDPRVQSSLDDMESNFRFISELGEKITEAHTTIKNIRKVKDQLAPYKKQLEGDETLVEDIKSVESALTKIEEALYQTKNRSRQDPLNFPIRVTNKLAHLISLYQNSNFAPPQQAWDVKEELSGEVDVLLYDYENIIKDDIPRLNRLIKQKSTDPISIDEDK